MKLWFDNGEKGRKDINIFSCHQNLPIKTCPKQEFFFKVIEKIAKKLQKGKLYLVSYFRLDALLWIAAIFVAVFCLTIITHFVAYRNKIVVMSFSYAIETDQMNIYWYFLNTYFDRYSHILNKLIAKRE